MDLKGQHVGKSSASAEGKEGSWIIPQVLYTALFTTFPAVNLGRELRFLCAATFHVKTSASIAGLFLSSTLNGHGFPSSRIANTFLSRSLFTARGRKGTLEEEQKLVFCLVNLS